MQFEIRNAHPPALPFTRRPRPRGAADIAQIQWHATRGATSMDRQVAATENWFANPANDRGGWGGSADFVVGPDLRKGGRIEIVQFGRWWESYSSWSAGFGAPGTIPAAIHGVAIEVAQPMGRDRLGNFTDDVNANFDDFTPETVEACIWLANHINEKLQSLGRAPIPSVRIPSWDQSPGRPIPRGHIGHDDLANGQRLGKSDPGFLFPWQRLLDGIAATVRPEPPPEPEPIEPVEDEEEPEPVVVTPDGTLRSLARAALVLTRQGAPHREIEPLLRELVARL